MVRVIARLMVAASVLLAATACGVDSSATFNADGSVVIGLKFLFPKSLMNGSSGGSVSGFSPSDIASDNAKLQAKYPGSKVVLVTEGDESGALVTVAFKTEKEAFAFLTQPSKLSPSASSSSKLGLNLSDTGGMFTAATHAKSGSMDTYTLTFALTVPRTIMSADGALFSQDRKTAIWKLSWLHSQTLVATTGGQDVALAAGVSPLQDARLVIAVGFVAIAAGFLLGMFLTWRGILPRRAPAPPASAETPQP